jgi:ParB family chromosome partitioning protein
MAKKLSGLGRGLDALFPTDFETADIIRGASADGVYEVDIASIKVMKNQPRTVFDAEKIEQLMYSIKEHGVLQPLVLVERSTGSYEIVAGERRFRAAKKAGLSKVPAIVRTVTDLQQLEIALVENIQREDLSPIDQAVSIKRLHEDFSQSYEKIALKLGKAHSTIQNLVRLLGLPAPLQQALKDGSISEGHARSLLALNSEPDVQNVLFQHIVRSHWSVRKAELFVKSHKESEGKQAVRALKMQDQNKGTKLLESKYKRPVRIQRTAKGGKLTIAFKDDADLEKLLGQL